MGRRASKGSTLPIAPRNTAQVTFHNGVTDEAYARLLADDAIMVSASKSEGYGLPLAEALKLGVPCVVSDIPPFHEVAGDGALFVEPMNAKAFAAAIASLDDLASRQTLAETGKAHIETFSWQSSARTLLAAADRLYANR